MSIACLRLGLRNSWKRGGGGGQSVHRSIGGVCVLPLLLFINQVTLSVIINADRGELEPVLRFSVDWVGYSHWGWGLGQL